MLNPELVRFFFSFWLDFCVFSLVRAWISEPLIAVTGKRIFLDHRARPKSRYYLAKVARQGAQLEVVTHSANPELAPFDTDIKRLNREMKLADDDFVVEQAEHVDRRVSLAWRLGKYTLEFSLQQGLEYMRPSTTMRHTSDLSAEGQECVEAGRRTLFFCCFCHLACCWCCSSYGNSAVRAKFVIGRVYLCERRHGVWAFLNFIACRQGSLKVAAGH